MNKRNSNFDILKFVLSIMVVCIHVKGLPMYIYPFLRIAVPLFFIMSSYFFFNKISKCDSKKEEENYLKQFVKRNLIYYFFWFIILLPLTLKIKSYFKYSIILGIFNIIKDFLFYETFLASWFIISLVLSTIIIYYLSKKLSNKEILLITLFIWLIICFNSSYFFILNENSIFYLYDKVENIYLSFPVALLWVTIGKLFADNNIKYNNKKNIISIIIFFFLLFIEWKYIYNNTDLIKPDCIISLIPLCISLFNLIINLKPTHFNNSMFLRNISTIIYPFHRTLIWLIKKVFKHFHISYSSYLLLFLTLIICFITGIIIIKLSKNKHFKFLKYAY